ncbi:2-dehydropantoate 2-reductase N-terminal domain-containing protein [Sporobacter termitidis]|uniref:ketopantoate reductase family protein n=1 Tax=Sporobacter termitidis TaxID=44749 RepID=UPI0009341D5A
MPCWRKRGVNIGDRKDNHLRILVYGTGVIGSLYAAYLYRAGCSVSVLAPGRRLEELRKNGLLYRHNGSVYRAEVTALEQLAPDGGHLRLYFCDRPGGTAASGAFRAARQPKPHRGDDGQFPGVL